MLALALSAQLRPNDPNPSSILLVAEHVEVLWINPAAGVMILTVEIFPVNPLSAVTLPTLSKAAVCRSIAVALARISNGTDDEPAKKVPRAFLLSTLKETEKPTKVQVSRVILGAVP